MNKSTRVFWVFVVSVLATLMTMTETAFGADPLNSEKKQVISEAKQNIKSLKQEKVAALHSLKDGLKTQRADLKRLFKEGKITKDQYKAQLKDLRQTMQTALGSARAEFQTALGLSKQDLKDLKAALKNVSNSNEITAALADYDIQFTKVVNELNGHLEGIAKDANIDLKDIIVSIS